MARVFLQQSASAMVEALYNKTTFYLSMIEIALLGFVGSHNSAELL